MKRIFVVILLSMFLLVSGCNTVSGLGKDIKSVGDLRPEPDKTKK